MITYTKTVCQEQRAALFSPPKTRPASEFLGRSTSLLPEPSAFLLCHTESSGTLFTHDAPPRLSFPGQHLQPLQPLHYICLSPSLLHHKGSLLSTDQMGWKPFLRTPAKTCQLQAHIHSNKPLQGGCFVLMATFSTLLSVNLTYREFSCTWKSQVLLTLSPHSIYSVHVYSVYMYTCAHPHTKFPSYLSLIF